MAAHTYAIEARGVRKAFGKTVALDNLDLRVAEGRIVGLIGPERRRQDHRAQSDPRSHAL